MATITRNDNKGGPKPAVAKSSGEDGAALDLRSLRSAAGDLLNQLGAQLIGRIAEVKASAGSSDPVTVALQTRVAQLGQIAAGLAVVDPDCLPARGAGYGSTVRVQHTITGDCNEYMLMVGSLVDLDANQVSLASPIGRALLGKTEGDEITVSTPHKQARFVVTRVVTLMELLRDYGACSTSH